MKVTIESMSGEGSTTVSFALAAMLKAYGIEVSVVDLDGLSADQFGKNELADRMTYMAGRGVKVDIVQVQRLRKSATEV